VKTRGAERRKTALLRHEAQADNEAIRLPNEQFSFCANPHRPISPHQLRSDKMLFAEECR